MEQVEKLVDLLEDADYATRHVKLGLKNMYVAQHLVANGVRVEDEREAEKGFSKEQLVQMFEKLVNSHEVSDRVAVASVGYGLERLVHDDEASVRAVCAKRGVGVDVLMEDPDEDVRATLARNGHALDTLLHDESVFVREQVAFAEYGLEKLVNDESDMVRRAVAWRRYGLDKLVNDPSMIVSGAVKNVLMDIWRETGMSLEEWVRANPERCALPENRKERLDDVIKSCEGMSKNRDKGTGARDLGERQ